MNRAPVRLGRRQVLAMAVGTALAPLWWRFAAAASPAGPAEALVEALAEQAWALIQSGELDQRTRLDRLTELLGSKTDVALLSRLVLGRHWQRLTADQQAGYERLFGDVVLRNLARRLDQYAHGSAGPLDQHFRITGSLPAGKRDILVRSTVMPPRGATVSVDWRLRVQDDQPVIIDLIIEGVSLLVTQRSEFAAVIERSDMDGLLAELRARASSTES
ncbi:MAG TPA: ABC transporter substrate-binding protein [Geminicoccaceae bacterium]|nr:ABC transporter substrate-binding protein [Geminicoccaceae bacterium]